MIIYILVNIAVVLLIVGFDLYRHQFNQLKFSSILLAISLNSIIDIYVIDKFNFITLSTVLLFLIWTFLQIYLNKNYIHFRLQNKNL